MAFYAGLVLWPLLKSLYGIHVRLATSNTGRSSYPDDRATGHKTMVPSPRRPLAFQLLTLPSRRSRWYRAVPPDVLQEIADKPGTCRVGEASNNKPHMVDIRYGNTLQQDFVLRVTEDLSREAKW